MKSADITAQPRGCLKGPTSRETTSVALPDAIESWKQPIVNILHTALLLKDPFIPHPVP